MWEKNKSVAYLNEHARSLSVGRCAEYVRRAVEAGDVTLSRHSSAKDYGSSLTMAGFRPISQSAAYMPGDVAVIQPIHGHPHGHMTMYNGIIWVSDFKQMHGLYPGPSYRKLKPAYVVYRKT